MHPAKLEERESILIITILGLFQIDIFTLPENIRKSQYNRLFSVIKKLNNELRIHWRLSTIFKTSEKVHEVMFIDM